MAPYLGTRETHARERVTQARGSGLAITQPLGEEEAGHSLVDDDAVVFEVELDAPLLWSLRPDDDFIAGKVLDTIFPLS